MLKEVFISLLAKYSEDSDDVHSLWEEIQKHHSQKNRFYHNLSHLENLYQNLTTIKTRIKDWDMVLFALFYHDIIYNVLKQNNEEQSAEKVIHILKSLHIEDKRIIKCKEIILATKGHQVSKDNDVNYFTDADLSILGSHWDTYEIYFQNIRKEYKCYPDFIYRKGRMKVVHHFLHMERIFKTDYFYNALETQAKQNLTKEIRILSGKI